MARTLLLDLDGTLVDTVAGSGRGIEPADAAARRCRICLAEQVPAMVGDGVAVLVGRAFAAHDRQPDATAVAEFSADYTAHVAVESRLYPEVLPVLTGLARSRLAPRGLHQQAGTAPLEPAATRWDCCRCCAPLAAATAFAARKPDPAHLLATLARAPAAQPMRR